VELEYQNKTREQLIQICEENWMNLGDTSLIEISHELKYIKDVDKALEYYVKMIRKPENFYFVCKHFLNITLLPFQIAILQELWDRPYPMLIASRGASKSFCLGVYCTLRSFLKQGSRIVIVGAAFRQSQLIWEYMNKIWLNAPVLQEAVEANLGRSGSFRSPDKVGFHIGDSVVTAVPLGTGETIRGLRANTVICDEFAFVPHHIYQVVVEGFTSVSNNPVQSHKTHDKIEKMKKLGLFEDTAAQIEELKKFSNQSIIAGTADYQFNHFYDYWKRQKAIISSRGDINKLKQLFDQDEIDENMDWRDYSIIRLPHTVLPRHFMDEKHLARAKATIHSGNYLCEYGACFAADSQGFFNRRLIESCVTKSPITVPSGEEVQFEARLRGNPNLEYVMGVDPASEKDNFSIVIEEVHPDHNRIVYCWTTTRKVHQKLIKAKLINEHDFYGYCCRKIRDLMKVFNIVRIGCDSQGGGVAIQEGLHDPDKIKEKEGELAIWQVPDPDPKKIKPTDGMAGLHILEIVNFAKAEWTGAANHGMRKDFEDKILLFPRFDPVSIVEAMDHDANHKATYGYDTLEDCMMEIEELKAELASIILVKTAAQNRDRWDTPEIKEAGGKKGRQRKDRYSALVIANMIARTMQRAAPPVEYDWRSGGFAHELAGGKPKGDATLYKGPDWYNRGMADMFRVLNY
jgi:hypothetical protein